MESSEKGNKEEEEKEEAEAMDSGNKGKMETNSFSDWSEISAPPDSEDDSDNSWVIVDPKNDDGKEDEKNDLDDLDDLDEKDDPESEDRGGEEDGSEFEDSEEECALESSDLIYGKKGKMDHPIQDSLENYWSEFIREKVLHRLPAKDLVRLRLVSTIWNKWIASPFFIRAHAHASTSISGVFHRDRLGLIYTPIDRQLHCLPDASLRFLPQAVDVLASARGLLCCRGSSGTYYVVNPLTSDWFLLPSPENHHGVSPAVAIVFEEPFVLNFTIDYFVICAYQIGDDLGGVYGFEVFSTRTMSWKPSSKVCVAELIEPYSGVVADGTAYWRTSMQTVVSYNPVSDECRTVVWPGSYDDSLIWELAGVGRRLHSVCAKGTKARVYELESMEKGWKTVKKMKVLNEPCGEGWPRAMPVRVQDAAELLFWVDWSLKVVDMASGSARVVAEDEVESQGAGFVPFTSSLIPSAGVSE